MKSILFFSSALLASVTSAYMIPQSPEDLVHKRQLLSLMKRDPVANADTASCNLSGAKMPQAPVPLPPPSEGLTLTHVVIGRGTQNYTCADSTANTKPVAAGAVASLFNVTCMAGPYPQMVSALPGISLRFPIPTSKTVAQADNFLSGHHYFTDLTTPFFNFDTDRHQWGSVACKKDSATPAPKAEDVPWLKLAAKDAKGCTISEVYRVDTAGGQPPANCQGMAKTFEVQYSAAYWMWSKPATGY